MDHLCDFSTFSPFLVLKWTIPAAMTMIIKIIRAAYRTVFFVPTYKRLKSDTVLTIWKKNRGILRKEKGIQFINVILVTRVRLNKHHSFVVRVINHRMQFLHVLWVSVSKKHSGCINAKENGKYHERPSVQIPGTRPYTINKMFPGIWTRIGIKMAMKMIERQCEFV